MKKTLKKMVLAGLMGLTMLGTTVCSAMVSNSQLNLGGIQFLSGPEYAQKVYGGDLFKTDDGQAMLDYGTFYIYYNKQAAQKAIKGTRPGHYMATSIATIANNNIATPVGLKVGMSAAELTKIYGEPDVTLNKHSSKRLQSLGVKYDKLYIYYAPNGGKICFLLEKRVMDNSKIVGILVTDEDIH